MVAERQGWAVEVLGVRAGDRILELGCGPGAAVELLCPLLGTGRVTAIDRSPKAIDRAMRRNAGQRARFACLEVAAAGELGERFDKVFAVNLNLFWTGRAAAEIEVVLKPSPRKGSRLRRPTARRSCSASARPCRAVSLSSATTGG